MKKFFSRKIAGIVLNTNGVIIYNKFNGKWIKIPKECYEAIDCSITNKVPVYEMKDMFLDTDDKLYYLDVLNCLEKIGLLGYSIDEEVKYGFVPHITFSITNKCNLDCEYCCKDSNINEKNFLPTEELKMIINKIVRLKPLIVVISGGEAMIREDFIEFIEYIKSVYDGKLILSTNATLINSKNVDLIIKNFYAIEISLDGYDEETCSKIRGKGVFGKVVDNIKLLKVNNFENISVSIVLGKHNYFYKYKFNEFINSLGAKPRIRYFCSLGRGVNDCEKYLEEDTLFFTPEDEYKDEVRPDTGHCNAGINQLFISDKGDLYLCPNLAEDEFKICNMKEFDDSVIEKIYQRDFEAYKNFDKLRPKNSDICKDCSINSFCYTCPAKTHLLKSDKVAFEKNCKFIKDNLYNKVW